MLIYPKRISIILVALAFCGFACEDAEYQLDNLRIANTLHGHLKLKFEYQRPDPGHFLKLNL